MLDINAKLIMTAVSDGEANTSELGCRFREIRGGSEIAFEEGENLTVIRVCGDRAEIERSGEYSGLMVIEPDRSANCCMHTPYGRIDFEITGGEIAYEADGGICRAQISYTSGMSGSGSSQIKLLLDVKTAR